MNCLEQGFWFEAGRAAFGLVAFAACLVLAILIGLWLERR